MITRIASQQRPFYSLLPDFQNWGERLLDKGNKALDQWTVELLRPAPFQHILEFECGSGNTLRETAARMHGGLLAGSEVSVEAFLRAQRKNRRLIENELLQLHLGGLGDLSYPAGYFHSIYSIRVQPGDSGLPLKLMQAQKMLRPGGKILLILHPRLSQTEKDLWNHAGFRVC
jgi:cyclopropane fatty-acyl-phospholipid synthase-like methyltransferase